VLVLGRSLLEGLLHQALRTVLGGHVEQKGSNITAERLRFDFSHDVKMTDEEKMEVEGIVNDAIAMDFSVSFSDMTVEDAKSAGAIGLFEDKYAKIGDMVKVYTVGTEGNVFSREICGGPHVSKTGALGAFAIKKEEASSAGIRRIKAVVGEEAKKLLSQRS
jgi:alanyl-tRNA synthetase